MGESKPKMSLTTVLKDLEELTTNAKQVQDDLLEEILKLNANTEYLRRFLGGSSNKELFKKNVPVVTYEDINDYIERVANGESSNVILGETITNFFLSSGTSGGKHKMFPANNKFFEKMNFISALCSSVISKHIDDVVDEGKALTFLSIQFLSTTPSGLSVGPGVSCYLMSDCFKNRSSKHFASPDQVILCTDKRQSMYCHLLCGLVQREKVVSLHASFANTIIQAITFLETHWKELCANIRSGHISEWITDLGCRESVSTILGGPNPELADLIEQECSKTSWGGIVTRLWPNTKYIKSVITGQMSQYISILDFYSNKLPILSLVYASSETMFGVNVNPLCHPEDVSYTFMPNMSYFEFLHVDEINNDEIVELVQVKLGCFYEPLVTNQFGLYRSRTGDILQVTGFYNNAPQFRFVGRKNIVLSVHVENTTEEHLLNAINHAKMVLDSSSLMLMDFTCCSDVSATPGHYVFYWELKAQDVNGIVKLDNKVMVECCCVMDESLDAAYRRFRIDSSIGALEIKVVQQGTFESLMEYFISKGASTSQYKTPLCINSAQTLALLEDKVLARFFSDKSPPL